MQLSVEIKLDPELRTLIEHLIESLRDLAEIIAPLTGYRVISDSDEEE